MTPAADTEAAELTLWRSIRAAVSSLSDDFLRFVAANLAWLAVAGATLLLGRVSFPAHLLSLLLVPATFGLARMAANSVRGRPARLHQFREGPLRRGAVALGLGCVQVVVATLGTLNIIVGVQAPTLPLVLSAIFSGYVLLVVAATISALWPLLMDPARDRVPIRRLIRLSLTVIATRPGRMFGLVLVESLLVAVALQAFVAAVILPGFGVLVAAWVVLTAADRIESGTTGPAG